MTTALLPGSLLINRAYGKLCEGLPPLPELATWFNAAAVEPFAGTWGDALRLGAPETAGSATGIATPMSAALGLTDLTALDPDTLQLDEASSRRLCAACDEHLAPEGVRLTLVDALQWRVSADAPVAALTEPPQWIIGEPLRPNLPRGHDARRIERWMNELQMLLYTHPVNIDREDRGLPPINVVWLWGFDAAAGDGAAPRSETLVFDGFAKAYRAGDLADWQRQWSAHAAQIAAADIVFLGDSQPRLKLVRQSRGALASFIARLRRPPRLADVLVRLREQADQA